MCDTSNINTTVENNLWLPVRKSLCSRMLDMRLLVIFVPRTSASKSGSYRYERKVEPIKAPTRAVAS